jgi:hypothetical protein
VWKRHHGGVSRLFQGLQCAAKIGFADEHVEVLGVSLNGRVAGKGIGPADQELDPGLVEHVDRAAIERASRGIEDVVCWCLRDGRHRRKGYRRGNRRAERAARILLRVYRQ